MAPTKKLTLREILKAHGQGTLSPDLQGQSVIQVRGSKLPPRPAGKRKD